MCWFGSSGSSNYMTVIIEPMLFSIGKDETARLVDLVVTVAMDYNRMVGSLAGDPADFTLSVRQAAAENGKKKPKQKAKKTPSGKCMYVCMNVCNMYVFSMYYNTFAWCVYVCMYVCMYKHMCVYMMQ